MQVIWGFFGKHIWILKVLIGIFLLFFINMILSHILKYIKKKSHPTKYDWKRQISYIFHRPIKVLVWILALSYIINVLLNRFHVSDFIKYINLTRNIFIVLDISWLLIRWKKEIQQMVIRKWQKMIDRGSVDFIGKIISIAIGFVAILVVLEILGLNIVPLMTFGGIGAAAIGFAGKDVIANFFGGLMIYLNRPFANGDIVEIPNQKITGHIEHIGWYNTCIREMNKVPVYIPNSLFSTVCIKNRTRMTHRRIEEKINIRYKDFSKIPQIIAEIRTLLNNEENIDKGYVPYVYFTTYSDYALNIEIKAYTILTSYKDFMQLKQDILFKTKDILTKFGANIPFPTTTIEIEKN